MTEAKFRLAEACGFGFGAPIALSIINLASDMKPISEFEAGAIMGVVLLKLIEALRAAMPRS